MKDAVRIQIMRTRLGDIYLISQCCVCVSYFYVSMSMYSTLQQYCTTRIHLLGQFVFNVLHSSSVGPTVLHHPDFFSVLIQYDLVWYSMTVFVFTRGQIVPFVLNNIWFSTPERKWGRKRVSMGFIKQWQNYFRRAVVSRLLFYNRSVQTAFSVRNCKLRLWVALDTLIENRSLSGTWI